MSAPARAPARWERVPDPCRAAAPPPDLCVEIGGTTIRAAAFDAATNALGRPQRVPAPNFLTHTPDAVEPELHRTMRALGAAVLDGREPGVVAVAYPGPVAPDGTVLAAPTLLGSGARRFDLGAACAAIWPTAKVLVLNDVTAAGYDFVARGWRDFCIVTVGSGIGNKVFVAGQPLVGVGARGGELGHLRVDDDPDALPCDCGGRGHLGGLGSGRGALAALRRSATLDPVAYAASAPGRRGVAVAELDTVELVRAFRAGDAFVAEVVGRAAGALGFALAAVHLSIGVERFVLAGGFALALGDGYRALVAEGARERTWDLGQDWDTMVSLGDPDTDSALRGAGFVVRARARARARARVR